MRFLDAVFNQFFKRILFEKSNWKIKIVLILMFLKSIDSNSNGELIFKNIINNETNLRMEDLQKEQGDRNFNHCNLTMLIKQGEKSDLNEYKNCSQKSDTAFETKNILGLGHQNLNYTSPVENLLIQNPKAVFNESNILNITENGNNTIYKPLVGRKMADYELIHRDQLVFRPVGYHQFDVIPQVIHQIPQNQYPMFRSGYLGYPYNPINYYRSPYITTLKRNRTRRFLTEDLDTNAKNEYKVEYEIMEFLSGNNSIFNQ
ncbi:uncharacterized protein cubi_03287 [Cryptosporidium ubiquitum]|uniref:Uncharacterized protein n=1 Tax=Cryptosporidium ubiquitum TaxID=857276 RepID=A0A1J4MDN5_9CRYT|nr:uncharacterized protein cubi_03287 [Cryptosporidium ubiquitum]OII70989.1 hypothetical protein cubi_03287 [Cryptosporidium ubiquitum]